MHGDIEKLIAYLQTLPRKQQKQIADAISQKASSSKKPLKAKNKKMQAFADFIEKLPSRLPKNYKFDREEANER